jgi:hypothetical protein
MPCLVAERLAQKIHAHDVWFSAEKLAQKESEMAALKVGPDTHTCIHLGRV